METRGYYHSPWRAIRWPIHRIERLKNKGFPLVLTQQQSGAQAARARGTPRKTLYAWGAATKTDPVEPFGGSGHWKAEDQALRDCPRRIRDLEEDKAIRKKAMRLVTNDRKSSFRSFMNTASPSRSRRCAKSSTFREAGIMRGAIALPVLRRKSGPGGSNGFGRCLPHQGNATAAPKSPPCYGGKASASVKKRWHG